MDPVVVGKYLGSKLCFRWYECIKTKFSIGYIIITPLE